MEKNKPFVDDENLWGVPELDSQVYADLTYRQDKWNEAESCVFRPESTLVFVRE